MPWAGKWHERREDISLNFWVNMVLGSILVIWFTANILPHLLTIAFTGKPYFALPIFQGMAVEMGLMALNLALPVVAILYFSKEKALSIGRAAVILKEKLAWHREGWKTLGWGLLAFILGFILLIPVVNHLVGAYPFPYNSETIGPINLVTQWYLFLLILALWGISVLGEEVMFRGYIQTALDKRYGAAIAILGTALLFALRHTPADLYWGWNAPAIQWVSRLGQLLGLALILSLVRWRSKSMIPTVIAHGLGWIYVVLGAPLG